MPVENDTIVMHIMQAVINRGLASALYQNFIIFLSLFYQNFITFLSASDTLVA